VSFLLDTNVVSEWVKPRPNPAVVSWMADLDEDRVFLSVVSLAEIRGGVEQLPAGARRNRLTSWLVEELPSRFEGRVLDVDREVADQWGVLTARSRKHGTNLSSMDAFMAATAAVHSLTLVTRNVSDFAGLELRVLNPWNE
jgi:predicted nucleic acid-binding protein